MQRWELWQGESGHSFFPVANRQARQMALASGYTLTWHCQAEGTNPAMRKLYEHLGWGEYRPMLDDDGFPYAADEDDGLDLGPDV